MKALITDIGHVEYYDYDDDDGISRLVISGWAFDGKAANWEFIRNDEGTLSPVGGWTVAELAAISYVKYLLGAEEAYVIARQLARGAK